MKKESHLLKEKVNKLLDENHRTGKIGNVSYDYTCPSPKNYPHQWLWDSCFHAIVLTHIDCERAKREIKTLLLGQKPNGMVPCVSIWKKRFPFEQFFYVNRITQSPAIPIAVERIYEKTSDKNFVKDIYPSLKKFFNWLYDNRDRNGNGLLEIIHPWEAGTDSIPSFDKQLGIKNAKPSTFENFYALFKLLIKYYRMGWNENEIYDSKVFVNDNVVFNSVYAKSLLSMVNLSKTIGEKNSAEVFMDRYKKTRDALLNLCWSEDDGLFYDLDKDGKQIREINLTSLMPLILPDLPNNIVKKLIEEHLLNKEEFWTPFPLASVPVNSKVFNPGNSFILYRGPTWIHSNWFLSKAILDYGYEAAAKTIIEKTVEMVEKSGFWEFYNPLTGEGYGQENLGWSTLVLDMVSLV